MKYVILAAGRGSRLNELTKENPKCLLKYKDKPIIYHFLDHLSENDEIIIVVGYLKDKIVLKIKQDFPNLNVHFVTNDEFHQSGTSHSLWLAKEYLKEGFIYANADVIPDKRMFEDLKKEGNIMFVDHNRRFRNNIIKFSSETAKIFFNLNHIKHESVFDRIFKIMGENHFHCVDITDYNWQEIDRPEDFLQ